MKVLLLFNSDFGIQHTIGIRTLPIAKELLKYNFLSKIICRDYNKSLKEFKGYIIRPIPFGNLVPKIIRGISIYLTEKIPVSRTTTFIFEFFSKRYFKNINSDIVHSWNFIPCLYKYIKLRNPKLKIVQDISMTFLNVPEGARSRVSLKYIDYFIAPSRIAKESLVDNMGVSKEKIFVIPFGVNINKFKPLNGKNSKIFKVAFTGALNNRKGIPYLIRAWKELNLKNAELNLYGQVYIEAKECLKNSDKYKINIHGFIDLTEELAKNHIFVFPSNKEGSAKAVYEALACGLPVVTTYNSGSIVRDEEEGFIIPTQDVKAIKEKILYFYNNPNEIQRMGKNARKLAEKYTWDRYGKSVFEVYKKIIIC